MELRSAALIRALDLIPHPEGGHFREVFRSPNEVVPGDGRPARSAFTAIHYLLVGGKCSRWHRLASDEVWVHLEGDPVDLFVLDGTERALRQTRLGAILDGAKPMVLVPAGSWQAAATPGEYGLMACLVGPGFEMEDLSFVEPGSAEDRLIRARWPNLARLL